MCWRRESVLKFFFFLGNLQVKCVKKFLPNLLMCILSRHFSEIKAIWLVFDSLIYFTTEHLILREKGENSSKHPFEKDLGFGG